MTKKLELRREKHWYEEPPIPETGAYKFRVETVDGVGERANHWPGGNGSEDYFYEYEYDEPESTPEYCGTLPDRQHLNLEKINELVKELGLDPKNVLLTASFSEDYLCVEVIHIRELNQQEQLEEYKENLASWSDTQKVNKEQELERLQWQIESLQRQAEELKKK